MKERVERLQESEQRGIYISQECQNLTNMAAYNNRHANVDGRKKPQEASILTHRTIGNLEMLSAGESLPQGPAHQLIIQ